MSEIVIDCQEVHKSFGPLKVLRGVTLSVHSGECFVLLGRSGCGKSVLLKHIMGLLALDAGKIFVHGQDITKLKEKEFAQVRKDVGMVFQGGALFDSLTVEENIAFPLIEERKYTSAEIKKRVSDILEAVGLSQHGRKLSAALSGGMRKRVAVARTIVRRPKVLLYDEPTTGLDPITTDSIDKLITKMSQLYGVTSIVVTHDMQSAFAVGNRIALLNEGRVYCIDTPENIRANTDPVIHNYIHGISVDTDM